MGSYHSACLFICLFIYLIMSAPLSQRIKSINDFNGDKNYTKAKSKLVNSRNSTYWPATHQHSLIVAKIKDWEDSHMLSLHICPKLRKPTGKKTCATEATQQNVQAWGLRCDPCYAHSKQTGARINRVREATLDSWASETGCPTRKVDRWKKHR
jgi:hypothetical protein